MSQVIRNRWFLWLAAGASLWLSASAEGQTLPERLAPPQKFEMPPLPRVAAPQSHPLRGADKVPPHLWGLPFGVFPGSPTVLAPEQLRSARARPAIDVPLLAAESDPARPSYPALPHGAKSLNPSTDPQRVAALARFAMPPEAVTRPSDDPTSQPAYLLITRPVPLAQANPAPLLRLSIPDPFEQIRVIQLRPAPADAELPEAARDRPSPKLPEPTPVK